VVARDGLGTINHTVLTVEALRTRGVEVGGVVLCGADGLREESFVRSNAREIDALVGEVVLGWLPSGENRVRCFGQSESLFDSPCFT